MHFRTQNKGPRPLTLCLDEGNKHRILVKVRIYKLTYTNSLVWIHKHRNLEFPRGKKTWNLGPPNPKFKFHVNRCHFSISMIESLKITNFVFNSIVLLG